MYYLYTAQGRYVEAEREEEHECTGWWSGGVTCQLCGYMWIAVWCQCANRVALECPACHALAGMPEMEVLDG
jgi:hypothetical protein